MTSETRKEQLRESQRRRREKLAAAGERSQVNIFMTKQSKALMEEWCLKYSLDRHDVINGLIQAYAASPTSLPFAYPPKS